MATVLMAPGAIPSTTEMLGGLPAYARTVAGLRDVAVQQLASRGLRHTRWTVSSVGGSAATAGPLSVTHRILHRVGPVGRYLWVGYHYMADEGGTTGAQIDVSAYTVSGVLIEGPATWSDAGGTLQVVTPGVGRALSARSAARDAFAHTGWATDGTLPTPRLLDVDSYQGSDVEIRVQVTDARVWDVCVADVWRGDL